MARQESGVISKVEKRAGEDKLDAKNTRKNRVVQTQKRQPAAMHE